MQQISYVGAGLLFCLALGPANAGTDPLWRQDKPGAQRSFPTVSRDGQMVFVGSDGPGGEGSIWAIDAEKKEVLWDFRTDKPVTSAPVLSQDGQTVFAGCQDNKVSEWQHSSGLEEGGVCGSQPSFRAASVRPDNSRRVTVLLLIVVLLWWPRLPLLRCCGAAAATAAPLRLPACLPGVCTGRGRQEGEVAGPVHHRRHDHGVSHAEHGRVQALRGQPRQGGVRGVDGQWVGGVEEGGQWHRQHLCGTEPGWEGG